MSQSMKCVLSVAFGMGLASLPSLYADKTFATSNVWFSVTTANLTAAPTADAEVTGEGCAITWSAVPSADDDNTCALSTDTDNKVILLNTSHTSPLTVTPKAAGDDSLTRVYANVTVSACDTDPTADSSSMGLCVKEDGDSYKWYYWNGSAWTASTAAAPTIGETYEICLEADIANAKVRWLAKASDATGYTDLTGWISSTGLAQIESVSFYGSTSLGNFGAQVVREITIDDSVNPEGYKVVVIDGAKEGASVFVDPESTWVKTYKTTGYDDATSMNTAAANGLTYLQSYVLGLDPTAAVNKPLVNAKQTTDDSKVSFKLDGVTVNETAGARVTYCVKAYDKPDLSGDATTSASASASDAITMDLPTGTSQVKYYKIEITID